MAERMDPLNQPLEKKGPGDLRGRRTLPIRQGCPRNWPMLAGQFTKPTGQQCSTEPAPVALQNNLKPIGKTHAQLLELTKPERCLERLHSSSLLRAPDEDRSRNLRDLPRRTSEGVHG